MSNQEAIVYLEYLREERTEKESPYWNAITKGIEALQKVYNVQSCLGSKAASTAKDGAELG